MRDIHHPRFQAAMAALHQQEVKRFLHDHPQSAALYAQCERSFLFGVPLHWMQDWPCPGSLFIAQAQDATLQCMDGRSYADFCLGDTGAMFGHSPIAVAQALQAQASAGLTCMLPSQHTAEVGRLLQNRFGMDQWQMALSASDANRFVLRWARAITQRAAVLVFDGCYHGAVDDTLVDLHDGQVVERTSLLGQVHAHAQHTRVVPFNDLQALERVLAQGDVACVLAEPALTNCGLVLPEPGFWPAAQALCQRYGTLLIMDETHTLSTGLGGYAKQQGLQPDFFVVGKAVAAGLPCAVYGFSASVAQRMRAAKAQAPAGHSGIGTTLSANLLSMAVLQASLQHLHVPQSYALMQARADQLEQGLRVALARHGLPWQVTRLGARMELQFMAQAPRHAQDVVHADSGAIESLLHLFMLNRGVVLTPFHSMMLLSPVTTAAQVAHLLTVFAEFLTALPE